MRVLLFGLSFLAAGIAGSAARAEPFCDALKTVAAGAAGGFTKLRGADDVAAHTSSFEVYRARIALPGAKACTVAVPGGAGLGAPSYTCEFPGAADPKPPMSRLAAQVAKCVGAVIPNPPPLRAGPEGPAFGFTAHKVRYDLSAARAADGDRAWAVTLEIGRPSPSDR